MSGNAVKLLKYGHRNEIVYYIVFVNIYDISLNNQ